MKVHRITLGSSLGFSLLLAAFAFTGCQANRDAPAPTKAVSSVGRTEATPTLNQADSSVVTLVTDASQVCMVNDQFMGRSQIPVQVDGKTYYGCCAMCKGRLQSDAAARTAVDPVTNDAVDKASAVIGKTTTGLVLYFASREHFQTYSRRAQNP
jgi:YHS domain-containing protein